MRLILGLVTALAVGILGGAEARADRLQDIISRGVVRIAVPADFVPFGYVDENRKLTGHDVELAEMVAEALGVKLEMEPAISANRIPFLLTDKVDIVISNLGMTAERAKQVMFSQPYIDNYSAIYGPGSIDVTGAGQLGTYKVAAAKGTNVELALSKLNPDANIMRTEDNPTAVLAYISGQADMLASVSAPMGQLIKDYPDTEFDVKFRITRSPSHMAVQMDQHNLLHWLDSFIFVIKGDGRLNALHEKYFGMPAIDLPPL